MSEKLMLGVGRADITPPIGSKLYGYEDNMFSQSLHDRLQATAFVFQSGSVKAVMISATVCLIHTDLADEIRREVAALLNIPKGYCLLSATHTHSGPNTAGAIGWGAIDEEYCRQIFIPGIVNAVRGASSKMQQVKLGVGVGDSWVGINRRELKVNNEVHLGQNPWGPYDPRMTILSFRNEAGENVANMIHFGCHGTAAGKDLQIGRDWSGIMTDRMEKVFGGVTAFFNGAEGDIGPRLTNGLTVGDVSYVEELGGAAAKDAVEICKEIRVWEDAELSCTEGVLKVPMKPRIAREVAEERLEEYKVKSINLGGARKAYYESVLASYENGYEDTAYTEIPQSILRLGNVAFAAFPYELFTVISMRIRQAGKIPHILSLSNTNGSAGYFVTEDQLCRGGYEVGMHEIACLQPYQENADWHLVCDTLKNLETVSGTEN